MKSIPKMRVVSALFTLPMVLVMGCSAPSESESESEDEIVGRSSENLVASGFSSFSQVQGGVFASAPAVTARSTNSMDVWALGTDNQIYSNFWNSVTGWFGWSIAVPGATFSSRPSATSDQSGSNMFVAAKGMDNKIYVRPWQTNVGSGNWAAVGSTTFSSAPAIVYGVNTLYLLARKTDNVIYVSKNDITSGYNVANWSAFTAIAGGMFLSEPAAVFDGFNVVVVARGGDNFFYTAKQSGSSWTAWSAIPGGQFLTAPAISSWGSGHVDVFGTGGDNRIYFASRDFGGWSSYQAIPNATFTSGPAAWSSFGDTNHIRLLAKGGNNAIWLSSYAQ